MTDDEHDLWANGQIKNEFNKELEKAQILKQQQIEQNISQSKELSIDEKLKKLDERKSNLIKSSAKKLNPKMQHVPRGSFTRLRIASDRLERNKNQKELRIKMEEIEKKRKELVKQRDREYDRDR